MKEERLVKVERENYIEPSIIILTFGYEDVITTSNMLEPDL